MPTQSRVFLQVLADLQGRTRTQDWGQHLEVIVWQEMIIQGLLK